MATPRSGNEGVKEAKDALLARITKEAPDNHPSLLKDLALAYRLVAGGAQPGSSIVESK